MNSRQFVQLAGILLVFALIFGCTQPTKTAVQQPGESVIQEDQLVVEDPALSDLNTLDNELVLPDLPADDYTQ